jgi:hypothetical protein
MKKYIFSTLFLMFFLCDTGFLIPMVISSKNFELYEIIFFVSLHFLFYGILITNIRNILSYFNK